MMEPQKSMCLIFGSILETILRLSSQQRSSTVLLNLYARAWRAFWDLISEEGPRQLGQVSKNIPRAPRLGRVGFAGPKSWIV